MESNHEAIYGAKVWRKSKEGPAKDSEGQFMEATPVYTKEDFRFTVANGYLYVFALEYPEDGEILVKSLGNSTDQNVPEFHGLIKDISILGYEEKPVYEVSESGLQIKTKTVQSQFPVVFKIEIV